MVHAFDTSIPIHLGASFPIAGYLRQSQIIGKKPTATDPGTPGLIPISASTLWQWVRDGKFPRPVKLGERVTAWRVEDIRAYLEKGSA